MRKYSFLSVIGLLFIAISAFTNKRGGDVFEIYLNGKQVLQQFVHIEKEAKTINLISFSEKDKIEVLYSHCGYAGKSRALTVRNEKNEVLKEFRFSDNGNARSRIGFSRKEIGKTTITKMNLYYASKEIPNGKLLAIIQWPAGQPLANR